MSNPRALPVARLGLLLLGLLLWLPPAFAVQMEDLYEAEVPVENRDRPQRQQALQAALAQVLVKITGNRSAPEFPELQALLESAPRYAQQFRYREVPGGQPPYVLEVSFDGPALERAVAEQGLPVWGRERPAVLVWLAVQEPGRRYLVGGDSGGPAREAMEAVGRARGVPLIFPLLDLEDRGRVSFADVSGGFVETVRAASARYRPDAILMGRAYRPASGGWEVRWRLLYAERDGEDWQSTGGTLEAALDAGVHALAGTLAGRLASSGLAEQASGTLVVVSGVRTLQDYMRVSRYLGGLGPVTAKRTYRVSADRAEFLVQARGGARDLERIIGLGDELAREAPESPLPIPAQGPVQTPPEPGLPTLRFRLL